MRSSKVEQCPPVSGVDVCLGPRRKSKQRFAIVRAGSGLSGEAETFTMWSDLSESAVRVHCGGRRNVRLAVQIKAKRSSKSEEQAPASRLGLLAKLNS